MESSPLKGGLPFMLMPFSGMQGKKRIDFLLTFDILREQIKPMH